MALLFAMDAFAGISRNNTIQWVLVSSEQSNNSNFVEFQNALQNNECKSGSSNRVRFSTNDEALLSLFLTAKTTGQKVGLYYKTSTNLPGVSGHGTPNCEVTNAWLEV